MEKLNNILGDQADDIFLEANVDDLDKSMRSCSNSPVKSKKQKDVAQIMATNETLTH